MTQPIFTSGLFQQIQNEMANVMALMFISTVKLILLSYWPYIDIFSSSICWDDFTNYNAS